MMRSLPIAALAAVVVAAPPAHAKRTEIKPYLAIDQTVFADLKNGGPAQTYTTLAAGIDASTSGPRAEAQVSARYEFRHEWTGNQNDTHVVQGLARGRFDVAPNWLSIEGGALGVRTRSDVRGAAPLVGLGNPSNVSNLYSVYVGPTLAKQVGNFNLGAFYRIGYSKVTSETRGVLPPGSPPLSAFDESLNHSAGASVGMSSGVLPFAWTASVGYTRDEANVLDQRFEGKYARVDVVVPVTPTVAVVGGVGYEKIRSSQRDPLRDAGGNLVIDTNGRFATDPASPRRLTYDESGFIWDTGVLWKPSRRTSVSARVGRRYGSVSYNGDATWQPNGNHAFAVSVYDGVTTFGQQINSALQRVPTRFVAPRDPFSSQFGGCVFGAGDSAGAGTCLSPALQSISSGTYRSRGAGAVWRYSRGRISGGLAAGYSQRKFYAPQVAGFAFNSGTDRTVYAQGNVGLRLDENSGIDTNVYANWYDSGVAGAPRVLGVGGTASYFRNFGPRLSGNASIGLYSSDVDGFDSTLVGAAQVGARYTF